MKTNIINILLTVLVLFLIVGCDDPDRGKSSKRIAQEELLHELNQCRKFQSETMNKDYCMEVLTKVEGLIRDGYFEDDEETRKTMQKVEYNETVVSERSDEQQQAKDDLDEMVNEIVGDI